MYSPSILPTEEKDEKKHLHRDIRIKCKICTVLLEREVTRYNPDKRVYSVEDNEITIFNEPYSRKHCKMCFEKYGHRKDFYRLRNHHTGAKWVDIYEKVDGERKLVKSYVQQKSYISRTTGDEPIRKIR